MPFDQLVYSCKKAGAQPTDLGRAYRLNTQSIKKLIARSKLPEAKVVEALAPFISPPSESLVFESRFECGNLAFASQVSPGEYNLLMSSDTNSRGHTQWFFYRVSSTVAGQTVKFNILNFEKPSALYNQGMQVLYHSSRSYELTGAGWRRGGVNVAYFKNNVRRHVVTKSYYTLTFTFTFDHSEDSVYFAYCFPYAYSDLQDYLDSLEANVDTFNFVTRKLLCRTLAGNRCDYLTITNPGEVQEIQKRKGVVLSARVHPGETVGSWMMQGALEFLVSQTPEADLLRRIFVFKVVPMLNPDGVINGNHRCSLAGCDLNRNWKRPREISHPEISSFKRLIKAFASKFKLEMITDLHGHSRKPDVFMYGCNIPSDPAACKLFPYIVSKVSSLFTFEGCRFGIQKCKESTMRITLFKELKLPLIYTCEASFCGAASGKYAGMHFTTDLLKQMGRDLCMALLVHVKQQPKLPQDHRHLRASTSKDVGEGPASDFNLGDVAPELAELSKEALLSQMHSSQALLNYGEQMESSDDSDSAPSEDDLPLDELKELMPKSEARRPAPLKLKAVEMPPEERKVEVKVRTAVRLRGSMVKPMTLKPLPLLKIEREIKLSRGGAIESPVVKAKPITPSTSIKFGRGMQSVGKTYYTCTGKRVMDKATQTSPELYPKSDTKLNLGREVVTTSQHCTDPSTRSKKSPNASLELPKVSSHTPIHMSISEQPMKLLADLATHSSEKHFPKTMRPLQGRANQKWSEGNDGLFYTMAISSLTTKHSQRRLQ
jgi:hypothetical protein